MLRKNGEILRAIRATANPLAAERDYMECQILDGMFANTSLCNRMLFSGGATLRNSYNLCPRLSHDLDLVTTDFADIPTDRTKRQLSTFKRRFKEFVFDELRTEINYAINQDKRFMITTDRDWRVLHNPEQKGSYPTLHLLYTSALNNSFEHICIEITPRNYDPAVISHRAVTPYAINMPTRTIPTVAYQQTFWDKIFALHGIALHGVPENRFFISRHYFDVALMAEHVDIGETYHLFNDTIAYQRKYTTKPIEPIESAADICLMPSREIQSALRDEYAKYGDQFLQTPPTWDAIVKNLNTFRTRLNNFSITRS